MQPGKPAGESRRSDAGQSAPRAANFNHAGRCGCFGGDQDVAHALSGAFDVRESFANFWLVLKPAAFLKHGGGAVFRVVRLREGIE